MFYSREELDWIEREWAFHLHGRSAFMSREDFLQLQLWANDKVPADVIVNAMDAYFKRRAKRPNKNSFVALEYLKSDVSKAMQLRLALDQVDQIKHHATWDTVAEPTRSDLRCRSLFDAWKHMQTKIPPLDSPDFLHYFDAEQKAFKELVSQAEPYLGTKAELLKQDLKTRLINSKLVEGTIIWRRAWEHNWMRIVCETLGIPS